MWQIEIVKFSEVDASGNMEVVYNILLDGKTLYPGLSHYGHVDTIKQSIISRATDLKTTVQKQESVFSVGEVLDI